MMLRQFEYSDGKFYRKMVAVFQADSFDMWWSHDIDGQDQEARW